MHKSLNPHAPHTKLTRIQTQLKTQAHPTDPPNAEDTHDNHRFHNPDTSSRAHKATCARAHALHMYTCSHVNVFTRARVHTSTCTHVHVATRTRVHACLMSTRQHAHVLKKHLRICWRINMDFKQMLPTHSSNINFKLSG